MQTGISAPLTNGPAAAAIVAAGAGCFGLGVFYVAGNVSPVLNWLLSIYKPAGALSGVSSAGILTWLVLWVVLDRRWKQREVPIGRMGVWATLLLIAGLLLTFPPVARLF